MTSTIGAKALSIGNSAKLDAVGRRFDTDVSQCMSLSAYMLAAIVVSSICL
jgi:hypothetical protein